MAFKVVCFTFNGESYQLKAQGGFTPNMIVGLSDQDRHVKLVKQGNRIIGQEVKHSAASILAVPVQAE